VLLHILRTTGIDPDNLEKVVDLESGLLGISGISGDMRQLHEATTEPRAQRAIKIFCQTAKKTLGAFIAILGGLDLLVFTGGIGEHDADVRERICGGLESFGVILDSDANHGGLQTISAPGSRVRICILQSDEETQIARHTYRLLTQPK
jgi:acetate kinase